MPKSTYFLYPLGMAAIYFVSGILALSIFHEHTIITMSAFFPEGAAGCLLAVSFRSCKAMVMSPDG